MAEEYNNRVVMGGTKWWDSSTTTSLSSSSSSVVFSDHQSLHMMGLDLQDGLPSMYAGEKPFLSTGEASPELMKPVKGTFSVDQFSHASSSGIFQALMESPPPPMQSGYGYSQAVGYGNSDNLMPNCNWTITTSSNKIHHEIPQFLKVSSNQQHRFINNINSHGGSSWNAVADPRPPPFFPTPLLQPPQLAAPTFHDKHHHKNNVMAVRNTSGAGRKSNRGSGRTSTASTTSTGSATAKRPRNEDSSNLPPFKVRKEKMGDRITALQQLVSPFGKTDTASVLSEAIEYIKFLHEQVNVLSTPYLKSGASLQQQQQQQQQIHDKFKVPEATRKDLKSRGLCLVPVSSTFPVAHETTMDFWTPAFGSTTFR